MQASQSTDSISASGLLGAQLLRESEKDGFNRWSNNGLQKYFKRQRGDCYCGVASIMAIIPYLIGADPKKKEYSGK
jgi:hypothetical protein